MTVATLMQNTLEAAEAVCPGDGLASFQVLEVLAAVLFAWLLLGELPRTVQLAGGLLVLAGVVAVKLGERDATLHGPAESLV